MIVGGLMSLTGSNLRKIMDHEQKLKQERGTSPFRVAVIYSDRVSSSAVEVATDYKRPVVVNSYKQFCDRSRMTPRDQYAREEYDRTTVDVLRSFGVGCVAYAGYMLIAGPELCRAFVGVNVHPADLRIQKDGQPKYVGDDAVRDQILAGEAYLRASTHLVEPKVDCGRVLFVSPGLEVTLGEDFDKRDEEVVKKISEDHQSRLKQVGDHVIFPKILEYIADGRVALDEKRIVHIDGKPYPNGYEWKVE